jgi:peptidoglycan L-alanyl-D-glutamate endopeptidase CwlK
MSAPLTPAETLFRQRLLACAGLYSGKLDGEWGPKTDAASRAWDDASAVIAEQIGRFDGRTEAVLQTILPAAQRLMRGLLVKLRAAGLDARAISGTRTYPEQAALFEQGRTTPGKIVTYARAGQSNHCFGIAVDVGIFAGGRYLNGDQPGDLEPYRKAGELAAGIDGLEWGGLWPGKKEDLPHYQAATGLSLPEIRAAFEAGRPFLPVK